METQLKSKIENMSLELDSDGNYVSPTSDWWLCVTETPNLFFAIKSATPKPLHGYNYWTDANGYIQPVIVAGEEWTAVPYAQPAPINVLTV